MDTLGPLHLEFTAQSKDVTKLPTLYIARRVIRKMCSGALHYPGEETGEAMVGLSIANSAKGAAIYVLDTIPPVEDTVREFAMFEHGDNWQGSIFNWWDENWELYRELRRASYGKALATKWDAPLEHIGDWHKQPGGIIDPSGGDKATARRFMRQLKRDYLVIPIVTLAHEATEAPAANTIIAKLETQTVDIRIDFWWMGKRSNDVEPLVPIIVANEDVPRLPPIVWWLDKRERFDREIEALEAQGLQILDVVSWNTRGHPPLDTCLTIYRPGTQNVVIAITPANYPMRAPSWRIAPIMRPKAGEDLFATLYNASSEIAESTLPQWKPSLTLVEVVNAIEERQDL